MSLCKISFTSVFPNLRTLHRCLLLFRRSLLKSTSHLLSIWTISCIGEDPAPWCPAVSTKSASIFMHLGGKQITIADTSLEELQQCRSMCVNGSTACSSAPRRYYSYLYPAFMSSDGTTQGILGRQEDLGASVEQFHESPMVNPGVNGSAQLRLMQTIVTPFS